MNLEKLRELEVMLKEAICPHCDFAMLPGNEFSGCEWCDERKKSVAALPELLEMAKDAERYRYMRNNATFQNRNGPGLYWYLPRFNRDLPEGERLDAAIDAAHPPTRKGDR